MKKNALMMIACIGTILALIASNIHTSLQHKEDVKAIIQHEENVLELNTTIEVITKEIEVLKNQIEGVKFESLSPISDSMEKENSNEHYSQAKMLQRISELEEQVDYLSEYTIELENKLSSIHVDWTAAVRKKVIEWLGYFDTDYIPSETEMLRVKEIMGISPSFYFEWYPAFEETGEVMYEMIRTVYEPNEVLIIERSAINNPYYKVSDLDGNNFTVRYYDDTIYSIWAYAGVCDEYVSDFLIDLEKGRPEELIKYVFYEAYDVSVEEQTAYMKSNFVDKLTGIDYKAEFVKIDEDFIYRITDNENNEMLIAVHSSGETFTHLNIYDKEVKY